MGSRDDAGVADFFADTTPKAARDWHMIRPFFADREPSEEAR
jgi:hypothetical protein